MSVPIIASGGAGKMEDFAQLFTHPGIDAGLAASIFHTRQVDIKELKQAGKSGFLVALVGVLVPLGMGTLLGFLFAPGESDPSLILQHVFIGTILTATSFPSRWKP